MTRASKSDRLTPVSADRRCMCADSYQSLSMASFTFFRVLLAIWTVMMMAAVAHVSGSRNLLAGAHTLAVEQKTDTSHQEIEI